MNLRQDAEDLLQDVFIRVLEDIRNYRGEGRFKRWLFGIATHACLDHLRKRKRWRVEAQRIGEQETTEHPEQLEGLRDLMSSPGFVYEIREHIAFCFSCISRTLEPDEQAAIMIREVLGFSNQEAANMIQICA
jgi:RNA polymerase sigma-70 factor (ECF subfamily)